MIKIDMDNGKRYVFGRDDYDDYEINYEGLVIYKGQQWVGYFRIEHLVGFFVELEG